MPKLCLLANAASSHTQKWALALAERGWKVDVLSFLPAEIEQVTVHLIPRLAGGKADAVLRAPWVRRRVRELKPDIVHAHYATSFGLLGALTGRHPLIISAWGSDIFSFPRSSRMHASLLKWILAQADVLCSTSRVMASEMSQYLEPGRKIEVIPFGVDTGLFTPVPPKLPEPGQTQPIDLNSPIVFGAAKYLHHVYGLDILVRALAMVKAKHPQRALLRIAGTGPEEEPLKALAAELGVADWVQWLGALPNREVAHFYQSLDVVVLPSRQESFGVAAVEGSACGRPVIAAAVGGLPEVVLDKETGLLIPPEDINELASAMEYMLDHPEERRRMGEAGRAFVLKHYDWQENVTEMERVYRRVLEA